MSITILWKVAVTLVRACMTPQGSQEAATWTTINYRLHQLYLSPILCVPEPAYFEENTLYTRCLPPTHINLFPLPVNFSHRGIGKCVFQFLPAKDISVFFEEKTKAKGSSPIKVHSHETNFKNILMWRGFENFCWGRGKCRRPEQGVAKSTPFLAWWLDCYQKVWNLLTCKTTGAKTRVRKAPCSYHLL